MKIAGWFGRAERSTGSTIEDVKLTLGRCPSGAELLQLADRHNALIFIAPPGMLEWGEDGRITVVEGQVEVAIRPGQRTHRMVTTLAHELHHLSQIHGEQYIAATHDNELAYIANGLDNEAKAETAANRVAYELAQMNIQGPAQEKHKRWNKDPQWNLYSSLRKRGYSHDVAADRSEPLWHSNGARLTYYTKEFREEWAREISSDISLERHKTASQQASKPLSEAERRAERPDRTKSRGLEQGPTSETRLARPRGRSR